MKKKASSVKGMTLVEVIIAFFVFGVISLLLVDVGSTVNSIVKNSNHVNKKTSIESPLVENGRSGLQVNYVEATDAVTHERDYRHDTEVVNYDNNQLQPIQGNLKVTMEYGGHEIALTGKSYGVSDRVTGNESAKTDSDLQYIYISKNLKVGTNNWTDVTPGAGGSGGAGGAGGAGGSGGATVAPGASAGDNPGELVPAGQD